MGKITKVLYEPIPNESMSPEKAGEFYYYHNMLDMGSSMIDACEQYELEQLNVRDAVLQNAILKGKITNPVLTSTIVGISSVGKGPVLITECGDR